MPVHNPRRVWLEEAIHSVIGQLYPCWELCICDDASSEPWLAGYLDGKANAEPRIDGLTPASMWESPGL